MTSPFLDGARWRCQHAVNSRAALAAFLDGPANLAEGDVLLGRVRGDRSGGLRAVMAHPPATTSDLRFETWLAEILAAGAAVKVDLKVPAIVSAVLRVLVVSGAPTDRWMVNADIVRGPGGRPPVLSDRDLTRFRADFPGATLSIGATTSPRTRRYPPRTVAALVAVAERLGPPVTVALRSDAVRADPAALDPLRRRRVHVTIWNDPTTDPATPAHYAWFRRELPDALIDLVGGDGRPVWPTPP